MPKFSIVFFSDDANQYRTVIDTLQKQWYHSIQLVIGSPCIMILLFIVFWFILNGRLDPDVCISGTAVTAILFLCICLWGRWSLKKERNVYKLLPRGIMYFFLLMREIILANIVTIKTILKDNAEPCIRTFHTDLKTRTAQIVLANSITLTPGTVTIQLSNGIFTVHCLNSKLADGLNSSFLEQQLLKMESICNEQSM